MSLAAEFTERLILDASKISWHHDRVAAWERGERIAPITIDMALNQKCNYACGFCYMQLQKQERMERITTEHAIQFIEDCAEIGVRGVSLVSDGESTLHPAYVPMIRRGAELGVSMASGTNGYIFDIPMLNQILPHLTYLRFNFSAGEPKRYAEIMGTKEESFHRVCRNIGNAMQIKYLRQCPVTIGMQMVLMPQDADQIMPLARLAKQLGVDYLVIKHCSDDEFGTLGVDYGGYERLYDLLREAETLSTPEYSVIVKWSKIEAKGTRSYQRCYGPPFILQISGSGLVAPCGMLFNERYRDGYHIGNIVTERFRDIVKSDRYWEVVNRLASPEFDAQTMCGTLCLQHKTNEALDRHVKGLEIIEQPVGGVPAHVNFI